MVLTLESEHVCIIELEEYMFENKKNNDNASQLQLKFFFIGVYVYSLHSMELQNELRNMLKGS
jgi:hypothetical protein